MHRRVSELHRFGTAQRNGAKFTRFTVGTNHGRWWVQATEQSPKGRSRRYFLWNREGKIDFATELEAVALLLEWVVHHKFHNESRDGDTEARATH